MITRRKKRDIYRFVPDAVEPFYRECIRAIRHGHEEQEGRVQDFWELQKKGAVNFILIKCMTDCLRSCKVRARIIAFALLEKEIRTPREREWLAQLSAHRHTDRLFNNNCQGWGGDERIKKKRSG